MQVGNEMKRKAILYGGTGGVLLAAVTELPQALTSEQSVTSRGFLLLTVGPSALFLAALGIVLRRGRGAALGPVLAFSAAILAGLIGFIGVLFVMHDAANWPMGIGAIMVTACLGVSAHETFDKLREAAR